MDDSFGARLRALREAAGLSQVALAGDDLHPSYVSLLEAGKRPPTDGVIAVLAARLGVPPETLLGPSTGVSVQDVVLAEVALSSGRPSEALRILDAASREARSRDIGSALAFRASLTYATALERTGRLTEAVAGYEALRDAVESRPALGAWLPVTTALVRCYREAGDLSRAVDLGEAALARMRDLQLTRLDGYAALASTVAGVYSERGDHVRAKVLLDELLAELPADAPLEDRGYAYWNAAVNAVERGMPGEGLRLAERAKALLSESADTRSQARIQVTQAWLLLAQQPPEPDQARSLLRAVLPVLRTEAGPMSVASAETELARCELMLGRAKVSARLARSALKRLPPEHKIERARAGSVLGAALTDLDDVEAGLLEMSIAAAELDAVDANRQAAPIWRSLSETYRRLGQFDQAFAAADRALQSSGVTSDTVFRVASPRSGSRSTSRA